MSAFDDWIQMVLALEPTKLSRSAPSASTLVISGIIVAATILALLIILAYVGYLRHKSRLESSNSKLSESTNIGDL